MQAAEAVLQRHWGHPRFRPGQAEAVGAALDGRDVLAVLPTGGGKSVCYQVPAVVTGGLCLVVSPLVALMEDQVLGLRARGVPATYLHAALPYREQEQRWTDAEFGRYRLLYVAPERLESEAFVARAERLPVTLLAVDEAHCISEWGHDFRPAYLRIAEAAERLGCPPTVAVTATATPEVRADIARFLQLRDPAVIVRGFDRPNLLPSIFHTENKRAKLLEVLEGVPGSAIVYAATRRGTEAWAERLRRAGVAAEAYHAGLSNATRQAVQARWQGDETRVVCATSAFGMGIDKPDVRAVVHVDPPPTLEAYYQEAGRAGRDGRPAYAVFLFAEADERAARSFVEEGHPDGPTVQAVYAAVCSLAQVPVGSEPDGPVGVDVEAVARLVDRSPLLVRAAVEALARAGAWETLPPHPDRGLLRFGQPAEAVRAWAERLDNRALAAFVRALLRSVHAEAFSGWSDFSLRALERRTELPRERLLHGLAFLAERGVLAFHPPATEGLRVAFAGPRMEKPPVDGRALAKAKERARRRLDDVLRLARSVTCRRHFLLAYFGESSPERCGRCDVCLGRHRPAVVTPEDEPDLRRILRAAAAGEAPQTALPSASPGRLHGLLDWLLHEGHLRVEEPLTQALALTERGRRFAGVEASAE
ncbi:MAG: ATP-dependent DNA helicase RecQ [Rhodothermales bacterium]|nr:ATP-dependent DNA helicase RecQ [Rhodothermales bacterium]